MEELNKDKNEISLKKTDDGKLIKPDYQRNKLFKKGVHQMADEKLEDAARTFEMILRTDPSDVEALLKLGYSRFHLDDFSESIKAYDKVLDIDITNQEAWNLKSLVHYEKKSYAKALDCVEKSIDSDPTYGMAWYNKACYLSLLNQVPDALDSLKRSIEIDVKNARKAVKDRDFVNVRAEDGFKRIIEVVVIESLRQGYHTIGSIVWTTFLNKEDAINALSDLIEKGLVTKNQKKQDFMRMIDVYDLVPDMVKKLGAKRRSLLGPKARELPEPVKNLKEIGHAIQTIKSSINIGNVTNIIENLETFIDNKKCGEQMISEFLEEHREIRLYKTRLETKGDDYFSENKKKMLEFFDNMEFTVTKKLRTNVTQN